MKELQQHLDRVHLLQRKKKANEKPTEKTSKPPVPVGTGKKKMGFEETTKIVRSVLDNETAVERFVSPVPNKKKDPRNNYRMSDRGPDELDDDYSSASSGWFCFVVIFGYYELMIIFYIISTEEKKPIPKWARGTTLKQTLEAQHNRNNRIDPDR